MRIILVFFAGFLFFFYSAEIFRRLFKGFRYSLLGILVILTGLFIGIFGKIYLPQGVNVLTAFFLIGSGLGLTVHHLLSQRFIVFPKLEKEFVLKHETKIERILEILPGLMTWIALTSPIWLSFTLPYAVAYLILIADVYWLLTALRIGVLIILGYRKMNWAKNQDWQQRLKTDFQNDWSKYDHLILIPTFKEPLSVLSATFNAVYNSKYPKDKIFLAVGFEERDNRQKIENTRAYLKKIERKIAGVFTTIHPFNLQGEVAGQGSNKNWMIKNAVSELGRRGVKSENVFVTTLDADFVIHPHFLAGSLYKYLSLPKAQRDKRTFTGVFLYHNNYWQTPTPMRLMAIIIVV